MATGAAVPAAARRDQVNVVGVWFGALRQTYAAWLLRPKGDSPISQSLKHRFLSLLHGDSSSYMMI
jgi:hypothetical protein